MRGKGENAECDGYDQDRRQPSAHRFSSLLPAVCGSSPA
jgi:hypothetical protein